VSDWACDVSTALLHPVVAVRGSFAPTTVGTVNPVLTSIAIVVAGVVVALVGFAVSARTTRRSEIESATTTRADIAVAVIVFGLVTAIFGGGYFAFLLLTVG
jgi:flagellar basal body-associated protein FliL